MKLFVPMLLAAVLYSQTACKTTRPAGTQLKNSGEKLPLTQEKPTVQLVFESGNDCSAVIVGPNAILTAAHCISMFSKEGLKVVFGTAIHDFIVQRIFVADELSKQSDVKRVRVVTMKFHDQMSRKYKGFSANEFPINRKSGGMDLAVIELASRDALGNDPKMAIFPTENQATLPTNVDPNSLNNMSGYSVGFGSDKNLRRSQNKRGTAIKINAHCEGMLLAYANRATNDQAPVIFDNAYIGPGDSGSPLFMNKASDSVRTVAGIASSGFFRSNTGKFVPRPRITDVGFDLSSVNMAITNFTSLMSPRAQKLLKRAADAGVVFRSKIKWATTSETCAAQPWSEAFK